MKLYFISFCFLLGFTACSSDDRVDDSLDQDVPQSIEVATPVAMNIGQVSATISSEVTDEFGTGVQSKGIVWSTDSMPTLDDPKIEQGPGQGSIQGLLDYLQDDTLYFVRAFAQTSDTVVFSEEIQFSTLAHIVYDNSLWASSQQTLDDFGAMGYTMVTGDVFIEGQDVSDLSGLSSVISIGGFYCFGLNVTNTSIKDFSGLNQLIYIGGPMVIQGNQNLNSLHGLNRLKVSRTGMIIGGNNLNSFEGLDSLEEIGTALYVDECSLFSISEDGVRNFQGMNNLTTIGVPIYINGSESLIDFSGLENVVGFTERIRVGFNNSLINFNGLSGLTTCEELWIEGNTALENFEGLSNLTTIDGVALISNNSSLQNLNGLGSLITVRDSFYLTDNNSLTSLSGLENLNSVGVYQPYPPLSDFNIQDNLALIDFCSLRGLYNEGTIEAAISISGNAYNPSGYDIGYGNCSL